jgi:large subunit ribosomal protein L15
MNNILSTLPAIVDKRKKRVGRGIGSGRGVKSGRGTTRHQAARQDIPLHFEGGQNRLVKKFPLLRGKGRNKPLTADAVVISLSDLNTFDEGQTIDVKMLIEKGIIKTDTTPVKVLANGTIEKKITVALPVSQEAKKHIEKAGGQVLTV